VANTAFAAVNRFGLKDLISLKTPDTDKIHTMCLDFMHRHNCRPDKVYFDVGGGGKEAVDRLRGMGYPVQSVGFGESVLLDFKRGMRQLTEKVENREERGAYKNRRAEMYGELSVRLNPAFEPGFALPPEYIELHRQLSPIPRWEDREGKLFLPPKNKQPDSTAESNKTTMSSLLGCSPDEADALVVAHYALTHKSLRARAGAV
jgi:hypothetical protein